MPWVQISPERLDDLPLFGYDKIGEDQDRIWYATQHGRMAVDKSDPRIFVDDVNDVIQLNPDAVLITEPD